MSIKLAEYRYAPTRLRANESVVLLEQPQIDGTGLDKNFMSCLLRRLSDGPLASATLASAPEQSMQPGDNAAGTAAGATDTQLGIFPQQQFLDAFYPWLEPGTAPTNSEALRKFLSRPGVRERLTSMSVRYIVWVDGSTQKTDGGGSLFCGLVVGGGGCFGFGWWEKHSGYQATVWDLDGGIEAGGLGTSVEGISVLLGLVAPIPLVAPVQGMACRRLSAQLRAFLRNDLYH